MRAAACLVLLLLAGCGVKLGVMLFYEHHMPADQIEAAGEAASATVGALPPVRKKNP